MMHPRIVGLHFSLSLAGLQLSGQHRGPHFAARSTLCLLPDVFVSRAHRLAGSLISSSLFPT